jgi:AcrR family transcriptional regulator
VGAGDLGLAGEHPGHDIDGRPRPQALFIARPRHPCQNHVLSTQNAKAPGDDVAARIAAQSLAKRGVDYASEVRRLLDAALQVMADQGTGSRARVADIVSAAGLSNDAFYRHFPSKDALVAALLEDGTQRLARYVEHQMDKVHEPEGKVRRWVEGVLSQTQEKVAGPTLAVLWNGGNVGGGMENRHVPSTRLAPLLHDPFVELGLADPTLVADLVALAVLGKVSDFLWSGRRPTRAETEEITAFCLRAVGR